MNWGELFFSLHKHCNLNKWEIWEYTLPQIAELMKQVNKYIEFEVSTRIPGGLGMFGGVVSSDKDGGGKSSPVNTKSDEGYHIATEDDINSFAKFLGGGF